MLRDAQGYTYMLIAGHRYTDVLRGAWLWSGVLRCAHILPVSSIILGWLLLMWGCQVMAIPVTCENVKARP